MLRTVTALALAAAALAGTGARADEPVERRVERAPVRVERQVVVRPRIVSQVVRRVVVERPVVYRTRHVVREVVVERPVFYRSRPVYREVFDEPYPLPPYRYGPPPFRPRPYGFAYGPGFGYGPGFYPPPRPRPVGFGYGYGPPIDPYF